MYLLYKGGRLQNATEECKTDSTPMRCLCHGLEAMKKLELRGAQCSNSGKSSSSDGNSGWLRDHVKLQRRELHLTLADLRMIYHLPGRSRYQHLVHSITSHSLERATSEAISHSSS